MFSPKLTDNANVNLVQLGERFISMTETPIPVQFDAETLETAGVAYEVPGMLTTAHPHLDRETKGMLNYAAGLGPRNQYRFFHLRPDETEPEVIARMRVREPAYMHSFGLSERFFVLAEFPFVVNPLRLALSGRPYIENYRWKPELGTRFTLIDRAHRRARRRRSRPTRASASTTSTPTKRTATSSPTSACFATRGSSRTSTSTGCGRKPVEPAELRRFRIRPATRTVDHERLIEDDDRAAADQLRTLQRAALPLRVGRRQRRFRLGGPIVKADVERRSSIDAGRRSGCFPGEPVFVAAPGARSRGRRCAALGRPRLHARELVPL